MIKLDKIYTKGGDSGKTSLGGGERVDKHDPRVNAYGTADEANAVIGLARLAANNDTDVMLARIQNDLFDLGADLCRPSDSEKKDNSLRISETQVQRLEDEIDSLNKRLEPLTSFVLPGGTETAAWLHLGRTVVRRCERLITELAAREMVNPLAIQYVNRLSDHLFVLARIANDSGKKDVLWKPGANR
jgi:cob(I)alamin adenosyltransferase